MDRAAVIFALLAFLCFVSAQGFPYTGDTDVVPLSSTNMKEVLGDDHVWIVEFYAPWCGHCRTLSPTYEKLATKMKGLVKVGAVNCDEDKAVPQMFGIRGFPTIKVFPGGGAKPLEYQGARTVRGIGDFAVSHMQDFVHPVTDDSADSFLAEESSLPHVLLFSTKKTPTPLYKTLAIDFNGRLVFGQAGSSERALRERFGVTSVPRMVVVPVGWGDPSAAETADTELSVYGGAMKHSKLSNFLEKYAPEAPEKTRQRTLEEMVRKLNDDETRPKEIDSQEVFDETCAERYKHLCVIAFVDGSEREDTDVFLERYAEVWEKAKNAKTFTFLWVDGTRVSPDFANAFRLPSGFPSLVAYAPNKKRFASFVGPPTTDEIVSFLRRIPSGKVRTAALASAAVPPVFDAVRKDEL